MNLTKEQKEFRKTLLVSAIGNSQIFTYTTINPTATLCGVEEIANAWEEKYAESEFCECENPVFIPVKGATPMCNRCGKPQKVRV